MKKQDGVRVIGVSSDVRHTSTVTFKDTPTGVIREVKLILSNHCGVLGRQATACEKVLGIVPGRFSIKRHEHDETVLEDHVDNRIMVQSLLPGSPAMQHDVKIGEWLMAVNDVSVDFSNISAVVNSLQIPCEVILTLQKIAIQLSPQGPIGNKFSISHYKQLIRRIHNNDSDNFSNDHLQLQNYVALYLAMDCDSETDEFKDAILYQYPISTDDNEIPLAALHGLFVTLTHVHKDIFSQSIHNSSLVVNDQLVHTVYSQHDTRLLVLAVPAYRMSVRELNNMYDRLIRLLCITFKSVPQAFSEAENSDELDRLFSSELNRYLSFGVVPHQPLFINMLTSAHLLALSAETKIIIDNQLSKLESADFGDMSEFANGQRRLYSIFASCLFYRGHIVASHMDKDDMLDAWLCLTNYAFLDESMNDYQPPKAILWQEIYPTRYFSKCSEKDSAVPGYERAVDSRWFLLAVSLNKAVLCVLLEAGGSACHVSGYVDADPHYVDHVECTLMWLNTQGVLQQCELMLLAPSQPNLALADELLPAEKRPIWSFPLPKIPASPKQDASPPTATKTEPESILKKKPPVGDGDKKRHVSRGIIYDVDSDHESHSTGGASDSSPVMGARESRKASKSSVGSDESNSSAGSSLFKGLRKTRNLSSLADVVHMKKNRLSADVGAKLVPGTNNTIFHYVTIDTYQGVYICPSHLTSQCSKLHVSVVHNFQRTALQIHDFFSQATAICSDCNNDDEEYGLLFQCSPDMTDTKKSAPVLNYWVVGRRTGDRSREAYVCFHDSVEQNLIEIAYKLNFGLYL